METLNWLSWTVASFIFVLGVMIFVHELGHHLMAKYLGIRVDVFSLGFGPRLFGFSYGETDYRVSLLPLGGYVKMAGEHYDEDLTGGPEEFLSRPKMHRFAVAIAGPAMNLGLAVLLLAGNFMIGIQIPAILEEAPVIGYVEEGSDAQAAGLRAGDEIVSLAGRPTPDWRQLTFAVVLNPGQRVDVEVRREGQLVQLPVEIGESERSGEGTLDVYPPSSNRIVEVVADGPAAGAGLLPGDEIVSVAARDEEADYQLTIRNLIAASGGQPVEFTIRRGDELLQKTIVPEEDPNGRAIIGILFEAGEMTLQRYGVVEALRRSVATNIQFTMLTFEIVGKLLTGQASIGMVSGPVEIANFAGQAAAQGPSQLIALMAMISLQLGIFNLLPIPILDGGVIALLLIEGVMGRDLSLAVKERILQAGFIFLVLLMGVVIVNDISKNM